MKQTRSTCSEKKPKPKEDVSALSLSLYFFLSPPPHIYMIDDDYPSANYTLTPLSHSIIHVSPMNMHTLKPMSIKRQQYIDQWYDQNTQFSWKSHVHTNNNYKYHYIYIPLDVLNSYCSTCTLNRKKEDLIDLEIMTTISRSV